MIWQRLRGALGIAIIWALAWAPLGIVLALYRYCCGGPLTFDTPPPGLLLPWLILFGAGAWLLGGAVAGLLFAAVLACTERGRSIGELRPGRTVFWGAIGALILPVLMLTIEAAGQAYAGWWQGALLVLGISGVLGGGSAAATLALARTSGAPRIRP